MEINSNSTPIYPLHIRHIVHDSETNSVTMYYLAYIRIWRKGRYYLVLNRCVYKIDEESYNLDKEGAIFQFLDRVVLDVERTYLTFVPDESMFDVWQHNMETLHMCYNQYFNNKVYSKLSDVDYSEFKILFNSGKLYKHIQTMKKIYNED